jgi:hypothetical protein
MSKQSLFWAAIAINAIGVVGEHLLFVTHCSILIQVLRQAE